MKKVKVSPEAISETPIAEPSAAAETPVVAEKGINKVGSLLKQMRMEKGLRLPDIAKRLCIRRIYLEAIEESNYKEIPPFPYGVGFIRSYADYLGLNSSNIVELYKEETNTKAEKDIYMLEPQNEATMPNRKYLIISLLAIMLIYVLWHFYNNQGEVEELPATETEVIVETNADEMPLVVEDFAVSTESSDEAAISATPEPIAATAAEEPEVAPAPQVVITEAAFEEPNTVKAETPKTEEGVTVKVKDETWVEVKDKSKLYLSKVLQPGTSYVLPEGGKGMILSVGKVKGVEVYINGKLTQVATNTKKTNIALDPFIEAAAH